MLAVVTRVANAKVFIAEENYTASIDKGFLVLLGVHKDDTEEEALYTADRICGLRVFEDAQGKMNLNPMDGGGASLLVISQFTLFADVSQRRPAFTEAARPDKAIPLYELVVKQCREKGFAVETGIFGADMQVFSQNDGPVTIIIDSKKR